IYRACFTLELNQRAIERIATTQSSAAIARPTLSNKSNQNHQGCWLTTCGQDESECEKRKEPTPTFHHNMHTHHLCRFTGSSRRPARHHPREHAKQDTYSAWLGERGTQQQQARVAR